MIKKIDPGLFARLMLLSAPARSDLLEYLGQGPVSVEETVKVISSAQAPPSGLSSEARNE